VFYFGQTGKEKTNCMFYLCRMGVIEVASLNKLSLLENKSRVVPVCCVFSHSPFLVSMFGTGVL
jgi:hypothetical protein